MSLNSMDWPDPTSSHLLACLPPPEGRARWMYALLAEHLVTIEDIEFDSISHDTVCKQLKKTTSHTALNPG